VRVLVLGPVAVRGAETNLGGPKPKALLSALLLQARHVVSVERLVDLIWDDSPPRSAVALVHTYVSALRRGFAAAGLGGAVVTRAPGYLLDVAPDDSDLELFEQHLDIARRAERVDNHERAARHYELAIGLWRGPAFGGVDATFARVRADGLAEERLGAEEGFARCLLAQGRAGELTQPLRALVAAHPLREEARGLLMRVLYETGRQADALAAYREGRARLLGELGIEPGERLGELHGAILDGTLPTVRHVHVPAARVVPRNLPPDIGDFTGREDALATVLRFATAEENTRTVVVSGFGGAGKSALAVHAAYRLRTRYPDGQLFADLRGYDREVGAFEVLGRFLSALGVDTPDLPSTVDDRVELYRRTVSGRKLIIVLDNARGERQLRPLLPGDPHCLVLITSRSRLTGLEGAEPVELDFFSTSTAVEMLSKIIGPERVTSQHAAAQRIANLCGGVPLAIRAAAAKLLARPHWPLKSLAARLSDERRRLDELSVGDLAIRSSLRMSYTELTEPGRRAFHLLCVLDLPDFGWWVAAPLLAVPLEEAEDTVEQLVDLRLLDVAGVDGIGRVRYRFHDLVKLFGAEHAVAAEPAEEITTAVSRVLATWLALVETASRRLPKVMLGQRLHPDPVVVDPLLVEEVEDDPAGWFSAETAAMVRAVERAAELGIDAMTTLLVTALVSSPRAARNEFDGWQRTHEVALTAARARGNRRAEAMLLTGLGELYYEKDEFAAAFEHFTGAEAHAVAVGDDATRAVALVGRGTVRRDLAEFAAARRDLETAAELGRRIGDDGVVAAACYGLGVISRDDSGIDSGVDAAAAQFRRCVELNRGIGDSRNEALALRGLSLCHRARDEHAEAAELSERATQILVAAGDELGATYARQSSAKALLRLGRTVGMADLLAGCLDTCVRHGDRFGIALVRRTIGELYLATGDRAAATSTLVAALADWTALKLPLWQARTLRDLAAADLEHAGEHWRRAGELFAATGGREAAELAGHTPATWYDHVRAAHL